MTTIQLDAESRADMGRGASRRLRRLENKIPAILYGGEEKPRPIHLLHNKVMKALETESIFSSVFDLKVDGKVEHVILKDIQRHPYKPIILHMDLQRVTAKDVLTRMVPLHFINEKLSPGVRDGGIVNHTMMQVEIRCRAKDLPAFIEVDLASMALNEVWHLSHLKLPKQVHLTVDVTIAGHDHPVVSIHLSKGGSSEVEETAADTVNDVAVEEKEKELSSEQEKE